MKNKISSLSLVVLFLAFGACTKLGTTPSAQKGRSPEEVVKSFIDLSGGSKDISDKKKLQDLCMGELKRAFERMSDEEFKIAYLNNNIRIEEIKILETTTQNDTAKVRYQVSVENKQGTDTTHEINEREVELAQSQGAWYIEFIRLKGSDKLAFTRGMIF